MADDPIDALLAGRLQEPALEDAGIPESRRPALIALSRDVERLSSELTAGFESRQAILVWLQRLCPRLLGEVPDQFFRDVAGAFQRAGEHERSLLAALLCADARSRPLDATAAAALRRRIAEQVLTPAYRRAFRRLRTKATEYVDTAGTESKHHPGKQRYIAMRPALTELDRHQRRAIDELLDGQIDSADRLRRWLILLEIATHGEIDGVLIDRTLAEPSTKAMLTAPAPSPAITRARELYLGRYVVPAMNRGVRSLRGKAKEEPKETSERSIPTA